jgi:cation transport regulator ChaC
MRFVLDQAPLTWAYYVLIGGLLIFVLFKGKREQRIVEVIEPLENTSVEFTKTIGDLYFQHKDYSNIIAKKITYFLETLRSKYYVNTNEITEDFIKKLALKSGNTLEKTQKLMHLIKHLKEKSVHSEADLLELNKQIEAFRL